MWCASRRVCVCVCVCVWGGGVIVGASWGRLDRL